jgi:hypothetical protein
LLHEIIPIVLYRHDSCYSCHHKHKCSYSRGGEEEEEEEEDGVVGSGGASSEKNAQLYLTTYRKEEEDEDEDKGKGKDVGGDAGLQNCPSAHPGTASSPIQPSHHATNTSSKASVIFHHGIDAKGQSTCQTSPLPPLPPDLGSSNTMDIDQANCNPSNVPNDSIGRIEVVVATACHHRHRDSFQETTSEATTHRTNKRGRSPGMVLALQMSSEQQYNMLPHPDSESSMDINVASVGKSQAGGSDMAHAGQDAMDVDGAHNIEPRKPAQASDTGDSALCRSSYDQNPLSGNKSSTLAPTNSRKRSKKHSTNHNPLKPKPKDTLVTIMEKTDSSFHEAILVDITINELEADMLSTLNSYMHTGGGYSCDRWRPHKIIWGKGLQNR